MAGELVYLPAPSKGANKTLRDVELTPFSNHLAPKLEGPGTFYFLKKQVFEGKYVH